MSIPELIAIKARQLAIPQQQEVLDFVESLEQKQKDAGQRRDPEGILAGMVPELTLEDFIALRREMWKGTLEEMDK